MAEGTFNAATITLSNRRSSKGSTRGVPFGRWVPAEEIASDLAGKGSKWFCFLLTKCQPRETGHFLAVSVCKNVIARAFQISSRFNARWPREDSPLESGP